MKTFPTIVTGIFVALALVGFLLFATFSSKGSSAVGTVVVWGSVSQDVFNGILGDLKTGNNTYDGVSYQEISDDQLMPKLVEGIASGHGPDLVIFPEEDLLGQSDKLQLISYSALSRRDFQSTFVQAGENFLSANGSFGIPFTVDPLVMYWNRTLFSNAGVAEQPTYWDEIPDLSGKLTKASQNGTIQQSAVALGTWENIDHAKEIFLTLMNQLGNPVVAVNDKGAFASVFSNKDSSASVSPADSAALFYTEFADPTKPMYSWNRSQPDAHDAFVNGELAIYFGFASELSGIRAANPNLNFDVAPMPAIRGGGQGAFAAVSAFSIPRGSANPTGALAVAQAFTSVASQTSLANALGLPPVRRDVSPGNASDPYIVVFRNASLTGFSFLDPDPTATDSIFGRMVDAISSGKLQPTEATAAAGAELGALLGVQ